jgi:hypothetical protein
MGSNSDRVNRVRSAAAIVGYANKKLTGTIVARIQLTLELAGANS